MRGLFTPVTNIKPLFPVLLPVAVWGLLFVGVGGGSTSGAWNTGTPFSFFNGIRGVVPFAVAGSTAVFVVYRVLQGYLPNGNIFGPLGLTTLYGVVGLIAAFNSPDGSVALWWSGLYLSVPIVLWGVAWSTDPLAQIRPLINATWLAVILAAGVLLVLAVIKLDFVDRILDPSQFLECRPGYWYDLTSGRIRGTGVGRYAAITGLIALSGLWQPKWRSMWAGILVISVLLLLYSGARGSFAGFGAGAALILVIYFSSSSRRTLVIGLLVTVGVIAIVWGSGAFGTYVDKCILRGSGAIPEYVGPGVPESPPPLRTSLGPGIPEDVSEVAAVADKAALAAKAEKVSKTAPMAAEAGKVSKTAPMAAEAGKDLTSNTFFSFSGRRAVWADGWDLFLDSPVVGYGFQADRLLLGTHMHNSIMHAMLQTGLLGTIPFISAIVLTWILLLRIVLKIGSLAEYDKHLVIQCAGIFAFFTMRSFPESTGAFFGVDWLILAVVLFYLQAVSIRPAPPGIKSD